MSSDTSNDLNHPILNLSAEEKRAFSFLFARADKDQLGVVTGENAVSFFERTGVSPGVLGEIWQIADTENRGLLTKPGFCIVLRLIGHFQAGREPSNELAFKPGPVPTFEGLQIPGVSGAPAAGSTSPTGAGFPPNPLQPQGSGQGPIRVPPLDPQKVQQYSSLFERSGAQNGVLDGATAKSIFEKAGLPNEILGRIWGLADREQRGALDQTEFIVAMHLLTSVKSRAMTALPNTLPAGLYEAAARRGGPPPSRQGTGTGAIPRQVTGGSVGAIPRTQSPLARTGGFGTPPPAYGSSASTPWLITPADKAKFDQFFNNIDTQGRGIIGGEQAVTFFSDSRLPEDTLAQIWDLADIKSEGQLTKDEFAVAMYLIRQQRAPNAPPLPAFLPPQLVPPSMRAQPQQTTSTAPAFDNANNSSNLPKSAADDLFGLDQPSSPRLQSVQVPLQPQGTGASASRDPFGSSQPSSPTSPKRFQPQPQAPSTMFKPFMPTSAFGASLAQQNTGGSVGSSQAGSARGLPQQQPQSNAMDDLLGDNEAHAEESSKLTNETTELANMSNQIGNLRNQMEQTQSKKGATQADLNAAASQKKDLETRLQQFRAQYEQEVRTVKDLEQQLSTSRESTKKLTQELAMLEGTYQDLRTQHQTVAQALQADQQENAGLKQRIAEINAEVAKLKPELDKMKLDARQQKGLASINKKQLTTSESDRDRLRSEKSDLEAEAATQEDQSRNVTFAPTTEEPEQSSRPTSPPTNLSATNPFFRQTSGDISTTRSAESAQRSKTSHAPTPSAFDALFGPSSAFTSAGQSNSRSGTPSTSFGRAAPAAAAAAAPAGMSDSIQSISSVGEHTPSVTPPVSDGVKDSPNPTEPPPPPASQQFTSSHLPVSDLEQPREAEVSSTRALPPGSRAGGVETPAEVASTTEETPAPHLPGSFVDSDPIQEPAMESAATKKPAPAQDDFDSAFAGFGEGETSKAAENGVGEHFGNDANHTRGFSTEFPPIRSLEHEDEDDSDDDESERGFGGNFASSSQPQPVAADSSHQETAKSSAPVTTTVVPASSSAVGPPPPAESQSSPPPYEDSGIPLHGGKGKRSGSISFPNEFDGLLPSREDESSLQMGNAGPSQHPTSEVIRQADNEQTPPASGHPSRASEIFHDAPSQPSSDVADNEPPRSAAKNAFDDFDDFDTLAPAQEAGKSGLNDLDFGFGAQGGDEFNPAFDSPAASMTNTMHSSQHTPVPASKSLHQAPDAFTNFQPSTSTSSGTFQNNSIQNTPQNAQHDWDAIFSGLDSSKGPDTSLSNDPWGTANGSAEAAPATAHAPPSLTMPTTTATTIAQGGGAITPGTEHDDPILKRLTGMGYPRAEALGALEKYDYDINRAVDHLTSSR